MFSFHRRASDLPASAYAFGWETAPLTDLNRLARCVNSFVWSPIVFKNRHRLADDFQASYFCGLDFDHVQNSLARARDYFKDTQCIIGLTRSHQKIKHPGQQSEEPACDRFRVIIPWERPITDAKVYAESIDRSFKEMISRADLIPDKSCRDPARFFYPSQVILVQDDPEFFRQPVFEPKARERAPVSQRYIELGCIPPWTRADLSRVIPKGERNNALYSIAFNLAKMGLPFENILAKITNSPTYGGLAPAGADERGFLMAIKNGFQNGQRKRSEYG